MKQVQVAYNSEFDVIAGNSRSQAAVMVLPPGASEGGSGNSHRGSDQWLYVFSGRGLAIVNGKQYPLMAGSLLLIEHGETHEIRNDSDKPLETLNFYVPPGYTADEETLPAGESA